MNKERKKVKIVEELEHFPFPSFTEFKKANAEGIAHIGIDRAVALQWAQGGIHAPKSLKIWALMFALLPFIAAIGLVVYSIVTGTWLLLLALPLLLIAFFIFHPSSAMIFGFIRTGLIGLTFVGLVYSFFTDKNWLLVLTIALVIIWYSQKSVYRKAINEIIRAMTQHEDLLCILWQGRAANIDLFNGNRYWVDFKDENGKTTHYED